MAHELSEVSGEVEFFSTKPAWHKLGTIVSEAQTAEQAIKLAHLDWPVEQRTLHLPNGVAIPDRVATVRFGRESEDRYLGTVGRHYRVIPNRTAFDWMDVLVGRGEAVFETAGALQGGRRIFLTAKLPDPMVVGPSDDKTERFLFLLNSHDGTTACRCLPTTVRVVCANTARLALIRGASEGISIRHTGEINQKLLEAERVLGAARRTFGEIETLFGLWRRRSVTQHEAKSFFEDLLPLENDAGTRTKNRIERGRAELMGSFTHGPGSDMAGPTMWGLFNAATHWVDHVAWRSRAGDRAEGRFQSTLFGAGQALKQKAADMLLAASN